VRDGGDVSVVADRVAFIEKTPRVRVATFSDNDTDFRKGRGGPDGTVPANELCGFCPRSWAWADAELLAMGFDGPDPVPMP